MTKNKNYINMWQTAFPELIHYRKKGVFKIIGPLIIGIEFVNLPSYEAYRPYFVMYPLWEKDVKSCMDIPIMMREYISEKGGQYLIPYVEEESKLEDIFKRIRTCSQIFNHLMITYDDVQDLMVFESNSPPLNVAPYSYLQASLKEAEFCVALYISADKAKEKLQEIAKIPWDEHHFQLCGVEIDRWVSQLELLLLNRENFLLQIETNTRNKLMEKLNTIEFVSSSL